MILGYTSHKRNHAVCIKEATFTYPGDTLAATTQLSKIFEFLLEDNKSAIRCTWNLSDFLEPIFDLLPDDNKEDLARNSKTVYVNGRQHFRLFYVPRKLLGITLGRYDVELYDLEHFFGSDYTASGTGATAEKIAKAGEYLLESLDRMGMRPKRLVSPVQIFNDTTLAHMDIPTIYDLGEGGLNASEIAYECLNREWRRNYRPSQSLYGVWQYDMTAAYPSVARCMRDTSRAIYTHSKDTIPRPCDWGFLHGTLRLHGDRPVLPFMFEIDDEWIYPTKGNWDNVKMTLDEVAFLYKHNLGSFNMTDGHFINFLTNATPLQRAFDRLHHHRSHSDLRSSLAKSMAVGTIGKFAEQHDDGNYGKLFNPIYHATILARVRLADAQFIFSNDLDKHVVSVLVDGVAATKDVPVKSTGEMGTWRKKPPIG